MQINSIRFECTFDVASVDANTNKGCFQQPATKQVQQTVDCWPEWWRLGDISYTGAGTAGGSRHRRRGPGVTEARTWTALFGWLLRRVRHEERGTWTSVRRRCRCRRLHLCFGMPYCHQCRHQFAIGMVFVTDTYRIQGYLHREQSTRSMATDKQLMVTP